MKRLIVKGVTIAVMATALALPLASPVFADTQPTQTTQTPTTGQSGSSATQPTQPTQTPTTGQSGSSATQPTQTTQTPTTGQPGSSAGVACEVSSNALMTPGNASSAPGSPFNEPGINSPNGGRAGSVYAGQDGSASAAHANSTAAVGQYDVACKNVSSH